MCFPNHHPPHTHDDTPPQPTVDARRANVTRFWIDLMGKRPFSKGWNECGFYRVDTGFRFDWRAGVIL
jgi:hypothetical protein